MLLKKWDRERKKAGYPEDTFLRKWIVDKIENYEEPTRKNRLPSEPVGFSIVKYLSAIFLGTMTYTVKQVSEFFNVRYDTLRRQHVEPEFKEKMKDTQAELASNISDYLLEQKNKMLSTDAFQTIEVWEQIHTDKFIDISFLSNTAVMRIVDFMYTDKWEIIHDPKYKLINSLFGPNMFLIHFSDDRKRIIYRYSLRKLLLLVINNLMANSSSKLRKSVNDCIFEADEKIREQNRSSLIANLEYLLKTTKDYIESEPA